MNERSASRRAGTIPTLTGTQGPAQTSEIAMEYFVRRKVDTRHAGCILTATGRGCLVHPNRAGSRSLPARQRGTAPGGAVLLVSVEGDGPALLRLMVRVRAHGRCGSALRTMHEEKRGC
jgi:hypothetical protein